MAKRQRFGYNVLGIDDVQKFRDHEDRIVPGGMLFFQPQIDEAKRTKATFPDAHVVIRFWPDSETYKNFKNPIDWVNAHQDLIGTGLIVQTMNEGGFTQEIIDWHTKLLTYLKVNGIDLRVGILGLNVGTPKPEEWPMADALFRVMATMRDRAFLILHEYFGGVITSGFIGGDPNNAGVVHGATGGTNMIPMSAWPDNPMASTLWHVGRYLFLKRHLASIGVPMPQIIIGEFGADFLGDLDAWIKSLHSTQGQYDVVDGWRDLWDTWRSWYPGLDVADVYMLMAGYADGSIYDDNIVAILFFCYGTDGNWKQYRTDTDLNAKLENYASHMASQPPVVLPSVPPPATQLPGTPAVVDRSGELMIYIKRALDGWK